MSEVRLPEEFERYTREVFGEERWGRFIESFNEPAPVSIRFNPSKIRDYTNSPLSAPHFPLGEAVPWCANAFWLTERPSFTLDPLFHAGCYYVQEAGSMFLDTLLRKYVTEPVRMLDLCAAPGGKSTLALSALPEGSVLFSNEVDRRRANILSENIQKWGYDNVLVTSNFARDYARAKMSFDVILTDVPCSGEGLFRRDPSSIAEWSIKKVLDCQKLQREILEDIWPCLKEGGLLIYSTCTFNRRENDENLEWIINELGAELLQEPERFIPGITRSEGLFMAALRKTSGARSTKREELKGLYIIYNGRERAHEGESYPRVELTINQALSYLRREALTLEEGAPLGLITVCYQGQPLGLVKNLGTRANNLYPKEWRIRK